MRKVSYKRHIAKTVTWRVVGTIDTFLLSWLISGNPLIGLKIGFSEMVTKMILYYVHERVWLRINITSSHRRHLIKSITWRFIGTIDTMLLSWFISGNPIIGLKVGLAEVLTKMFLYYFHERVWYKINFGLDKRNRARKWKKILPSTDTK
ncbi:DUF2061 domain-containing protein [Flagellimonas hymeniacidonis]|uniref:DUF2061 domain-containing protein n=1 Tax=Flagellimonas hymeniacidonis TaxID=2603628 RepID=A0A5C8V4R7_9FLAO|nr:DUF2061 domain-containing protein [Flagellimonas hymeniacidonis]TXN35992.1 DUF2061 domain-containing protein [Flagellimonas hymeniacidonis]